MIILCYVGRRVIFKHNHKIYNILIILCDNNISFFKMCFYFRRLTKIVYTICNISYALFASDLVSVWIKKKPS